MIDLKYLISDLPLFSSTFFSEEVTAKQLDITSKTMDAQASMKEFTRYGFHIVFYYGTDIYTGTKAISLFIHEVAHIICDRIYGDDKTKNHGREWQATVRMILNCFNEFYDTDYKIQSKINSTNNFLKLQN